ncbi:MAG: TrpR YerC/YecD [Clostridia bacterium]|nr:TrpR YerC/YecD [Clostridia bacterium]
MNIKIKNEQNDALFNAILTLNNIDECYAFFEDICSVNELNTISQRLKIVKMIREGKVYSEIAAETGASTATITRVNRSIQYGNGSYEMVFERLKK